MSMAYEAKKIYARDLGIKLNSLEEAELFKWFLASLLFGKPIQQKVVEKTYDEFIKNGLSSPQAILKAGLDKLVKILDKGHYVRYDFSTATKLINACTMLLENYGSVTGLIKKAQTLDDLEFKLLLFKGVGPTTVSIFLIDIKPIFSKIREL